MHEVVETSFFHSEMLGDVGVYVGEMKRKPQNEAVVISLSQEGMSTVKHLSHFSILFQFSDGTRTSSYYMMDCFSTIFGLSADIIYREHKTLVNGLLKSYLEEKRVDINKVHKTRLRRFRRLTLNAMG